jgi:hypothetical protein
VIREGRTLTLLFATSSTPPCLSQPRTDHHQVLEFDDCLVQLILAAGTWGHGGAAALCPALHGRGGALGVIRDACCRYNSPVRARKDGSVALVRCPPDIISADKGSYGHGQLVGDCFGPNCSASNPPVALSCCLWRATKPIDRLP